MCVYYGALDVIRFGLSNCCVLCAEYEGGGREILAEPEIPAPRELMFAFCFGSVATHTLSGIGAFLTFFGELLFPFLGCE